MTHVTVLEVDVTGAVRALCSCGWASRKFSAPAPHSMFPSIGVNRKAAEAAALVHRQANA